MIRQGVHKPVSPQNRGLSYTVAFLRLSLGFRLLSRYCRHTNDNRAPLLYFSTNDIGVTLNRLNVTPCSVCRVLTYCRFSQDMQLVDKTLPSSVLSMSARKFSGTCLVWLTYGFRGFQAIDGNCLAIQCAKVNNINITPLRGSGLSRTKGVFAHVATAAIA